MPVRRIPRRRRSVRGFVPGRAPGATVGFESTLERDFANLQLFDARVEGIEEQPIEIIFRDPEGRQRTYVPDYLVRFKEAQGVPGSQILVEVKPRKVLRRDWQELRPKYVAARDWARRNEMVFRLVTESGIRGPRLANVQRLNHYRRYPPDAERERKLLEALARLQPCTSEQLVGTLAETRLERGWYLTAFWRLVAIGTIAVDLDQEIGPATLFTLGEERP